MEVNDDDVVDVVDVVVVVFDVVNIANNVVVGDVFNVVLVMNIQLK